MRFLRKSRTAPGGVGILSSAFHPPTRAHLALAHAALDTFETEEVVFVLQDDGTVKKRVVQSGIQDINYIEIISGLKAGETVVTDPYTAISKTLKDGMKVKVVSKDKLFQ